MAGPAINKQRSRLNLDEFRNERYVFALVSKARTIIGVEPECIVRSWEAVKPWYGKRWIIGYLGYEQGYRFMDAPSSSPINNSKPADVTLPNVYFAIFKNVHVVKNITVPKLISPLHLKWKPQMSKQAYLKKYTRIKKHIAMGDIYQANLSYRLTAPYDDDPENIFSQLYHAQPTTHAAFIKTPSFSVSSGSPELFLDIKGRTVETNPMKGTCGRGRTAAQDNKLAEELRSSVKEQAELNMITDVHRNDLARTAIPGTVQVKHKRRIRAFDTVWQADAVIQSRLEKKYSALDVIETSFPAGSITGAPKLRAMEILHELEPVQRNIYTGSIGYFAPNGDAQFSIAIRTAYLKNHQVHYHVGGGLVFDSKPQAEYQETLDKAKVIL